MTEMDPSGIAGNVTRSATVNYLFHECYEDAWRGCAEDFRPRPVSREISWGHYVEVKFDPADPGVVKAIAVETPEEVLRFAGPKALEVETEEREILARLLGVEPNAFAQPPQVDPDTLTPEEREKWDKNIYPGGHVESLYAFGEAFGRQPMFDVSIDPELARDLYDQALAETLAKWDQERLTAELMGVGFITGDRDEPRVEVLVRHIDEHPEYREAIKAAVEDAIDISTFPTSETIWPHTEEAKAALAVLQQKLANSKE